jgi:hypothetical protein
MLAEFSRASYRWGGTIEGIFEKQSSLQLKNDIEFLSVKVG